MEPFPTIAEAGKLIAAKQLSPVELTRTCLDRVKKLDPKLQRRLARWAGTTAGILRFHRDHFVAGRERFGSRPQN